MEKIEEKIIEYEILLKTQNPLLAEDSHRISNAARELIQLIKENPEAINDESLKSYSEDMQSLLRFIKCFAVYA